MEKAKEFISSKENGIGVKKRVCRFEREWKRHKKSPKVPKRRVH
jgi:hypothetical protein